MPTIICSYCDYVGQGDEIEDKWQDALNHEKTCSENTEDE